MSEQSEQIEEAGRGLADEDDGLDSWALQARIFGGIAVFMLVIATIYWFMSYEPAGTTFLVVAAGMTGVPALYLAWPRGPKGEPMPPHIEPGHDPHDGVWFPEASIWPFAIGGAMVLVANGFLLGRWMLIPSAVLLVWAIVGMIRQGRHRL
ncbi:MAG: aa3-type cytochrome oxidase subunit IV [Iamia sp.]